MSACECDHADPDKSGLPGAEQMLTIIKAVAAKLNGLDMAARLAPKQADAHVALRIHHTEIVDEVGVPIGSIHHA